MTILDRYVELHPASQRLSERAGRVFPDGVTHDMRRNSPFPLYVQRAAGSRKWDVDGHEIVDYVMGHGALLLGHNHPLVMAAVAAQAPLGTHYGASHELEIAWGELVQRLVPSAQKLRFTSSGTEATMMALRLARAYTGREKIVRLREHFHGWNDSVTGQPARRADDPGVARAAARHPRCVDRRVPQNDAVALERTLREEAGEIAAMILEPTGAHWGTEPIDVDFVRRARELTAELGIVLIFDEVITGFRVSPGGAQQAYGITPDMTTMAKIIAGGLPGGCVAGRADIIDQIAVRERWRARADLASGDVQREPAVRRGRFDVPVDHRRRCAPGARGADGGGAGARDERGVRRRVRCGLRLRRVVDAAHRDGDGGAAARRL